MTHLSKDSILTKPILERPHLGGIQKVYRFKNGLGASVVRFNGSYGYELGLWELGVIKFEDDDWGLTYETSIASDVIGNLSEEEVQLYLSRISRYREFVFTTCTDKGE